MSPAAFQKAMNRGMAASPFAGSLVYKSGSTSTTITCVAAESVNKQEQDDYGATAERVLKCVLPKDTVTTRPNCTSDQLIYKGRTYQIKQVDGDADCSAGWIIEARSPLK